MKTMICSLNSWQMELLAAEKVWYQQEGIWRGHMEAQAPKTLQADKKDSTFCSCHFLILMAVTPG